MLNDDEMIARYLATRGATKCPTACVAETTGRVGERDRVAVAGHRDSVAAATRADFEDRMKEKRRRRLERQRLGLERSADLLRQRLALESSVSGERQRQA